MTAGACLRGTRRIFASVVPTPDEVAAARTGDDIVASPEVVMDRAFTLDAPPEQLWPWLIQLGKRRAGWYLPRSVERFIPTRRRAVRAIDPRWQQLTVGDVIPDYGGRDATFEVDSIDPLHTLVFRSVRGHVHVSWSITLTVLERGAGTRVHLRLVLGPVHRKWLATSVGELFDAATIAGMAAGLDERIHQTS